jgi:hypothetical protein
MWATRDRRGWDGQRRVARVGTHGPSANQGWVSVKRLSTNVRRINMLTRGVEANLKIDDLIRESWRIYRQCEDWPFLVKPSIPILFFGDSTRYFSSELKVITLGLNPSRVEFPKEDKFLRFSAACKVYPRILEGASYEEYLQALNGYFRKPPNHPYELWFNSFEHLLRGLDCSYYGNAPNTALGQGQKQEQKQVRELFRGEIDLYQIRGHW